MVFEKAEMGVPFRVSFYAAEGAEGMDSERARGIAAEAFARVAELNAALSDYDSDSELSRLSESSGSGRFVRVGEDLWTVLECAQRFAQRSGGAFDVTVGPLVSLWRVARRKREIPPASRIQEALSRIGFWCVVLDPGTRSVRLDVAKMRLDVGGIAKGFAAQEAVRVLKSRGVARCMVEGGGDIAVGDAPPGRRGWRIEAAALDLPGAPEGPILEVSNCAIATSGDRYQRLMVDGVRYSHIVNPWTGLGLTDHSLVTVVAESALEAEALSKVVAVLGPERGLEIVGEVEGAEARVVRAPGGVLQQHQSANWESLLAPR